MPIDPNAFSSQLTNHLDTPYERRAKQLNVLAQQQATDSNALQLKQAQQQDTDQQAVRAAWAQSQGNQQQFLENLKTSAPHLYNQYAIQFAKDRFDMANKMIDATAQRVGALKSLPPEQRQAAWPMVRQQLIQMGHDPRQEPALASDQYPGDGWVDVTLNQGMAAKEQVAAQQKAAEMTETNRHNTATETQASNALNETTRHNKVDEGISAQNASTAATNADINRQLKDAQVSKIQMENRQTQIAQNKSLADLDNAIATVDRVGAHPGLSAAVGIKNPFGGQLPYGITAPGSRAADFKAEVQTLKSQQFLNNIQAMRGMGSLSNMEGLKVQDAISSLDEDQSEASYRRSLQRVRDAFVRLRHAYEVESKGAAQQPAAAEPTAVGPNGHQIVYRNGAWVDAQSGQPIQ
jgi:hypothetical protein